MLGLAIFLCFNRAKGVRKVTAKAKKHINKTFHDFKQATKFSTEKNYRLWSNKKEIYESS